MKNYLRYFCLGSLLLQGGASVGQQVMLQGFYYDIPKAQCGAAWADTLTSKAAALKASGFTHIWTPPFQGNGLNSGGYDPKNLYIDDQTALGSRTSIFAMVNTFKNLGIDVVGDMIYNHRDGGLPENNDAVLDYVNNHAGNTSNQNCYQFSMPSDRYRMILPVGGSSGNGTGNYYINIASRTGTYNQGTYMLYVTTNKIGGSRWSPVNPTTVVVPENGSAYPVQLGTNHEVKLDWDGDSDEFQVSLNTADFNATDTLFVQMININPGDVAAYSNHRIWKIWYDPQGSPGNGSGRDLADVNQMFAAGGGLNANYKLRAQTFTNFCGLPNAPAGSAGCMNAGSFRPNYSGDAASDVNATCLGPAWSMQSMDYFYDYDHQDPATKQKLIDWTIWSWEQLGIRGLRMDAIKHFPASFVGDLLCAMHTAGHDPSLIVGEWYGMDPGPQSAWLTEVYNRLNTCSGAGLNPKVFDFNLRDALKQSSDGNNDCSNDVRRVYYDALTGSNNNFSGMNVVTMLNNHDFRSDNPTYGSSLVWDRADALNSYAYLLTNNHLGVPTIFYPDYYGYPATVPTWNGTTCVDQTYGYFPNSTWTQGGLKTEIDELIGVLKNYIHGSTGIDYINKFGGPALQYYSGCYQRSLIYQNYAAGSVGGQEVVNAINYGDTPLDVEIPVSIRNGIVSGTIFTKIAGTGNASVTVAPSTVLAGNPLMIRVTVPPHSYSSWVQNPIALPVNMIDFQAKALPKSVRLSWQTASEKAFKGYEIQRSTDSKEFVSIGWVDATGQSNYQLDDTKMPEHTQELYYRIKLVDQDGTSKFSKIKSVVYDVNSLRVLVYPNPAHMRTSIQVANPRQGTVKVVLLTTTGQQIFEQSYQLPAGVQSLEIPVKTIPSGEYQVMVSNDTESQQSKLIIK